MDPMCEVMVPGFLARRLEWMVVSLPEMGKHSKPALPGPGQFGVFTLEMNLLKEIS